jgi:hypothetical protein
MIRIFIEGLRFRFSKFELSLSDRRLPWINIAKIGRGSSFVFGDLPKVRLPPNRRQADAPVPIGAFSTVSLQSAWFSFKAFLPPVCPKTRGWPANAPDLELVSLCHYHLELGESLL